MSIPQATSVRPELVEGLPSSSKEVPGFDKLGPNGVELI